MKWETGRSILQGIAVAGTIAAGSALIAAPAFAWEPTKSVEFVVPAGSGGGADQMARAIQGIVQKHNLMNQPLVVVNKGGGAGAAGFLDVKGARDPHKLIITLSNLFTTPLGTGIPFNWTDLTPVSMLALDNFVLWVNAESPYQTAEEYIAAVKEKPGQFKMGGTGSKQEDQIITVAVEQQTGAKFTYVPYGGGGEVAVQLVGNHINSSVNNPIEAVAQWRAGALRPLCVFDEQRMPYENKVTADMAWSDVPTCKEAGLDVTYQMLRGIFMPGSANEEQVQYFVDLLNKVRETDDWKALMESGGFNPTALQGEEYRAWLEEAEGRHRELMTTAGFITGN
ncbi:Bug family tripartite tricarboxylate transporter substrate binding protein [Faunimonas sp. B44]|uniref:Bug family tripartite tricarboxylate transporter substrate binding protein n=1 Tax=Faunimonas sp. B44 TaxID=3461493 RepID=UPI004043C138